MPALPQGALQIGLAVAIAVSFVGFFVGVSDEAEDAASPLHVDAAAATSPEADVPAARSWAELRLAPRGGGSGWSDDVAALRGPSRLDAVDLTGTAKAPALADRMQNRAYDGAPPTIPHPIRQDSASECLACHDEGLRIRGATASAISHREMATCTQCHVVSDAPMPADTWLPREVGDNSFVGLAPPTAGARAWSVAPPVIPHPTSMREQCLSCHGTLGREALRSSHPERETCTQCHAVDAAKDLRPGVASLGPGGALP